MKHLIQYAGGKVEPLLFNGKLISIKLKITTDKTTKTIIFKDSYLLLPFCLRNLCKSFGISMMKRHFPFLLTDINYTGAFPNYEYWTDITEAEHQSLRDVFGTLNLWSFKDEAIKYCKLDCKCLFDVLVKFNELVFKEFKINIHTPLTLPSVAMAIYNSQYLPKDSLYLLLGPVEEDIRQSYTGGAVDVYLPHNAVHQDFASDSRHKLYYYDVNSLYPFVRSSVEMPIGRPIAF